jgi:hypothetical protein
MITILQFCNHVTLGGLEVDLQLQNSPLTVVFAFFYLSYSPSLFIH